MVFTGAAKWGQEHSAILTLLADSAKGFHVTYPYTSVPVPVQPPPHAHTAARATLAACLQRLGWKKMRPVDGI